MGRTSNGHDGTTDSTRPAAGPVGVDDPVFVVSAARSGSTLLRIVLDAHPDLACPPESLVAKLCEALEQTWRAVLADEGYGELSPSVLARIRATASEPLVSYAAARGKARWCDKSLANVRLHGLLRRVFPRARFVCLFRHALDVVASGLEASTWGFAAYGFEEYVRASPGNVVQALVRYWCDYTERVLALRDDGGGRCTTVRYEDLVRAPEATLASLVADLDLAPVPDLAARAFDTTHDLGGGDHKLPFTETISAQSIGLGRRVPVSVLDDGLLQRMNANLERLGYPPVDRDWNHRLPDALGSDGPVLRHPPDALAAVLERPGHHVARCDHDPGARGRRLLVVVEDRREAWAVDLQEAVVLRCSELCDGAGRLLGDLAALRDVVGGRLNLGSALRTGQLRSTGLVTSITGAIEVMRRVAAPSPNGERPVAEPDGAAREGS
jgi:hypothetical protein